VSAFTGGAGLFEILVPASRRLKQAAPLAQADWLHRLAGTLSTTGDSSMNATAEIEQAAGFAARHLAESEKGRDALRRVLDWLEASGLSLDGQNQEAILELQRIAWEGWAGTVREAMHEALGD
jgi:hypothetical protein